MNKYIGFFVLFSIFLFNSCIEENPDLVNPKPQNKTINVRFINLSGDKKERNLKLNEQDYPNCAFGYSTQASNPPADSALVSLYATGAFEYKLTRKAKFVRTSYNTFLALPSPRNSAKYRAVDTLIQFSTSTGLPEKTINTYLKFVNAYPDTSVTFSFTDGCPNGSGIQTALPYRSVSSQSVLKAGRIPISVLKNTKSGVEIIGLFDLDLNNDIQYTVIISEDDQGTPQVNLLNEMNGEVNCIFKPTQIFEKLAFIRAINFSDENITVTKLQNEVVESSLNSLNIGAYKQISACGSQNPDTVAVTFAGFTSIQQPLSLNVNKKYTFLTADSKTKKASVALAIPQAAPDYLYDDKALIRVVNADETIGNITLSIGARKDTAAAKYVAGEKLCDGLKFGAITPIVPLYLSEQSATLPLTLFASGQPAKLNLCAMANVERGKSYLLVLKRNSSDQLDLYLIEESDESKTLSPLPQGQFVQYLDFSVGAAKINISYESVLQDALVNYSFVAAFVGKLGQNTMKIANTSYAFNAVNNFRKLIISAGTNEAPDIFEFDSEPLPSSMLYSSRRFINASNDVPKLTIRYDSDTGSVAAQDIEYKKTSNYVDERIERNYSLFFMNAENNKLLYRLNEVKFVSGKRYAIVFGGSEKNGYSVNFVQEY
jgi:hypothetical protein